MCFRVGHGIRIARNFWHVESVILISVFVTPINREGLVYKAKRASFFVMSWHVKTNYSTDQEGHKLDSRRHRKTRIYKLNSALQTTTGCPMMRKGSRRGLSGASAQRLDHPSMLGIGGIGCDIASGGASAHGDC